MFKKILESIIKDSGGSVDKIKLENFMEAINHAFIFAPWNYWLGVRILKNPLDLMILQEIIFEKRPDTIIECGTAYGGSAYYMACLMDLMGIDGKIITIESGTYETHAYPKKDLMELDGKIVTIDSNSFQAPVHPKIEYIHSDCLAANIPNLGNKTMVVLDCDHSANHVAAELEKFAGMVSFGQYLIVEDTDAPDKHNGPAAAVEKFLEKNKDFVVDKSREKYEVSSNPGGYLQRVS